MDIRFVERESGEKYKSSISMRRSRFVSFIECFPNTPFVGEEPPRVTRLFTRITVGMARRVDGTVFSISRKKLTKDYE